MKNQISISVIMPVFNAEPHIKEAIDSILNQTFIDFEFIIVDDGSTDHTWDIIQSYNDKRIVSLQSSINLGNYPSRNKGMKIAKGKYIAVMDGDDMALPERLAQQYDYLETHSDVLCVGSEFIFHRNNMKINVPLYYDDIRATLLHRNCMMHASLMIRSATMRFLDGYNEDYRYASDYDLICRISLLGKIECIQNILMVCRWHPQQISQSHNDEQSRLASIIRRKHHVAFINKYKTDDIEPINEFDVGFSLLGAIISYYTIAHSCKDKEYEKKADDMLDIVMESDLSSMPLRINEGLLGLGCGIIYLLRSGYIEGDEDAVLEDLDDLLISNLSNALTTDYDFDRLGWIYYFTLRNNAEKFSCKTMEAPFIKADNNSSYRTFSDEEYEFLMHQLSQSSCYLEYGCGLSTQLANGLLNIKKIVSVESDKKFWKKEIASIPEIELSIIKKRILPLLIDIGQTSRWGYPINDEKKQKWPTYANIPYKYPLDYDLILVDGRFRVACVLEACLNANPKTKILIHDYFNRPYYAIAGCFLNEIVRTDTMVLFTIKPNNNNILIKKLLDEYKYLPQY